jgi:hypothetical protein
VLRLLIDTSVWLDLAKRRNGQRWIVPLRVLGFQKKLELLVPSVVIEEFERNRPRAEAAVTSSVLERFRQLRQDLHEYGGNERLQWIEEMSHRIPMVSSGTLQNFSEINELLRSGTRLEPSDGEFKRAMNRGLEKKAPFHLNKNSTGDALIIELYAAALQDAKHKDDAYCFVTSNHLDFSTPNGDRREPHPDLTALFSEQRSGYFYGVEGLDSALVKHLGAEFTEESDETEFVHDEPRTLSEILEAESEYFDKLWYHRHMLSVMRQREAGQEPPAYQLEAGGRVRARIETYPDYEWPMSDFDLGMISGKLSALRWVLGDEWDFLDT